MSIDFNTFVVYFNLIGKRKPAKFASIFYALAILLAITAVTPVWSVNAPTAYEVKYNGKGQPFFLPTTPKCTSKMAELITRGQTMTSLQIAETTGRQHSNVMRDIRNLLEQLEDKAQFNFELGSYQDANGQNRPCYLLTKKDSLLLASGYDANLRAKIINRWEELEYKQATSPALSPIQMQLEMMKSMQIQLQEIIDTKEEVKQLKSELAEVKQRTTTTLDQSTIVAYVSRNNIKLDVTRYGAMGKKASTLCKKRGVEVTKINDVRWGLVSVYPDAILDQVFGKEASL